MKIFFVLCTCRLILICSASLRSIPFLSFIEPIFARNFPLVSLIFLRRSLVFPSLLFPSISLRWSLRKAFVSLLALLWNSAFRWLYLSFSPLPLASLLFSPICKTYSDNHFALLHFFSLGMILITASCKMSQTSTHSSSGTLSNLIPWIYFSQYWNQIVYILCSQWWRNSLQSRLGADCGSDHELLIAKFRLKLKKVGKTTRSFIYELNQIPYNYTVEVTNRFKGLDLIECLKNYGQRFMTLYRRQRSRPSPRKSNAKGQNGCLKRP